MPNRRQSKWEQGGGALTDHEELVAFKAQRDDAFRDMTVEKARAFWDSQGFPPPVAEDVPLGALHKARGQWLDATDAMLAESAAWLEDHGYKTTYHKDEIPMLTPETRDAQRVMLGKPPLGETD